MSEAAESERQSYKEPKERTCQGQAEREQKLRATVRVGTSSREPWLSGKVS